jgi:hypothetical protein
MPLISPWRDQNENAKEWNDEPRVGAVVCNRSDVGMCRQDIRLCVECAGRQYRRLHHGTSTGSLTPIGKAEACKLVMPMAVSPNKKHLYAVVRSQPPRVLSYAIDPATASSLRKHRRRFPTACPMSRPIAPGATYSPPPMAATNLR